MDRKELGGRLLAFRQTRGLSLAQVARLTDISSSFLSLVEQGKSDITISRLVRLGDFYGVGLSELVDPDGAANLDPVVVRHGRGISVHSVSEGIEIFFLSPGHRREFAATLTVFEPGYTLTAERNADDEAFAYVLSGRFRLVLGVASPVTLRSGDTVIYRQNRTRTWTNLSTRRGRLLHVSMQRPGNDLHAPIDVTGPPDEGRS